MLCSKFELIPTKIFRVIITYIHEFLVHVYVCISSTGKFSFLFRPLWLEFPRDKNTYTIEDQMMIGKLREEGKSLMLSFH